MESNSVYLALFCRGFSNDGHDSVVLEVEVASSADLESHAGLRTHGAPILPLPE